MAQYDVVAISAPSISPWPIGDFPCHPLQGPLQKDRHQPKLKVYFLAGGFGGGGGGGAGGPGGVFWRSRRDLCRDRPTPWAPSRNDTGCPCLAGHWGRGPGKESSRVLTEARPGRLLDLHVAKEDGLYWAQLNTCQALQFQYCPHPNCEPLPLPPPKKKKKRRKRTSSSILTESPYKASCRPDLVSLSQSMSSPPRWRMDGVICSAPREDCDYIFLKLCTPSARPCFYALRRREQRCHVPFLLFIWSTLC